MKTKNILFRCVLVALVCCICLPAGAQNTVTYGYDAAGNRTSRNKTITMARSGQSVKRDSTTVTTEVKAAVTEPEVFEEKLSEMKIIIYPNPTQGLLRVDISGAEIPAGARIYLYNSGGGLLRQWNNISGYNTIDISAQPAGSYLMRIVLDGKNASTWKIVKE